MAPSPSDNAVKRWRRPPTSRGSQEDWTTIQPPGHQSQSDNSIDTGRLHAAAKEMRDALEGKPQKAANAGTAANSRHPQLPVALTNLETIQTLKLAAAAKDAEIAALNATLNTMRASASWRFTHPLRVLVSSLRRQMQRKEKGAAAEAPQPLAASRAWAAAEPANAPSIDRALTLLLDAPRSVPPLPADACVVVPIYNSLVHLERLLPSLFRHTDKRHQIILIDDCSPDSRVWPYLQAQAEGRSNVQLLRNDRNLGFVATVNRGAAYAHGHFAILNTDTVVPASWLERLLAPMVVDSGIASTTPFGNAATVCGFPRFGGDSSADSGLIEGVTLEETDLAFQCLSVPAATPLEVPTGVGFCMGINGDIWRQIGSFDEELFAQGYGEENDWCQRAIAAGFRNVLVPNLFVYHAHGGSFGSEQKRLLQLRNGKQLAKRWPAYNASVASFIASDPWATLRLGAVLKLCLSPERRPLIILDHALGGGANSYSQRLLREALGQGRAALLLTWNAARRGIDVEAMLGDLSHKAQLDSWSSLLAHRHRFGACEFVYNNMFGWEEPLEVLDGLVDICTGSGAPLTILFHDFLPVCPSHALLGHDGQFCGAPDDPRVCDSCLPHNDHARCGQAEIRAWRAGWQRALNAATEVRFFSASSLATAKRFFSFDPDRLCVEPHAPLTDFNGRRVRLAHATELVIGAVGSLNWAKGAGIVRDMARRLAVVWPNARIVVIGEIDPTYLDPSNTNLLVHGSYERERLPDLLEGYGIGVCVVPSIIPETFSFVTQELMQLEMPLACFDLGAPAERVGSYRLGSVVRSVSAEAMLDAALTLAREAPLRRRETAAA